MTKRAVLRRIDIYIVKKYLSTFFLAIALIIGISIVFDLSENIDNFISKSAPLKGVIFDYYLNFIPYFANLFSGLFNFIAVIYFTSKMSSNSEIIALLSSGVSYNRLMRPYMMAAGVVASMSWILGNFIIPPATDARVNFRNTYINRSDLHTAGRNIHRQLEPGLYIYMRSYNNKQDVGYKFAIEKFEGEHLAKKLNSDYIKWDRESKKWVIHNYYIRDLSGEKEVITTGTKIDTTLRMLPVDFSYQMDFEKTMSYGTLNRHIKDLKLRGIDNIAIYEIEKHTRTSSPFSVFILALIGAALSTRKIRGGLGLHLGLGLFLSFSYIMFMQVSTVFAIKGGVEPLLAVWIPNIIYSVIAVFLYKWAAR